MKKRLFLNLYELPVCRRASALIALTEHERDTYRALGLKNRVECVPNGIDLPPSRHYEWPFPHFPVRKDAPLVLFMGRLHPLKGADIALNAFLQSRKAYPEARLVIAGPDEHGMSSDLVERAAAAGAGNAVLLPGAVKGDVKAALLSRANIFVLPTLTEGFSIAILEAMAHSCAVLTTTGAYFPEIEKAGAGWISERNAHEIGLRLSAAYCQPAELERIGDRGRRLVSREYTWDSVVDKLEALYLEFAERAKIAA